MVEVPSHGDRVKEFLKAKLEDCEKIIKKRKKKNRNIKILYYSLVGTSVIGSTVVVILSSVAIPPLVFACVSSITTITSSLGIRLNLEDKKKKLEQNIQKLNKIKDKLNYVINCNGNLSKEECDNILEHFRLLWKDITNKWVV